MGLRSALKKKLVVPGEKGAWVEIQPLTASLVTAAEIEAQHEHVKMRSALQDIMAALSPEQFQVISDRHAEQAAKDWVATKLEGLHLPTVLNGSVTAWSYDEELKSPADQLMPETAEWLAREIVELNWRPPVTVPPSGTS